MENLEDVADRAEAERQQSLRDLEQLYEWLQQFEDPPPAPRPPPPQQFRNGLCYDYFVLSVIRVLSYFILEKFYFILSNKRLVQVL